MIPHIAASRATSEMYEEESFLRNPVLTTFLVQILASFKEFDFALENSLTLGVSI